MMFRWPASELRHISCQSVYWFKRCSERIHRQTVL